MSPDRAPDEDRSVPDAPTLPFDSPRPPRRVGGDRTGGGWAKSREEPPITRIPPAPPPTAKPPIEPPEPTTVESVLVNPTLSIEPSATTAARPQVKSGPRCPGCDSVVAAADRFCESCGRELGARRIALPRSESPSEADCDSCGGGLYDADGYCRGCGQLRPQPDRFEADLGAVSVVTDRGLSHARNEDSVAAAVVDAADGGPEFTVIAVCDGVSTSEDPQAASGAASRAGVDAVLAALAEGRTPAEAAFAGLAGAARAVRAVAVREGHAPSCTYVSAILRGYGTDTAEITVANVGDSRAYWLNQDVSSSGSGWVIASQRLTVDDSYAQALVDAGAMDEEAAMRDPRAHTLLRWLGADSGPKPWSDSCVRTFRTGGPGVLLLCSDGLWNYRPDAADLAALTTGADRMDVARRLVEFALRCGGSDNITVALAPVS
ncbi:MULTISPECIES: phosphatase [Nocardia]|uniref:phosphatase n=1 Tax=Nocardia TaxID=1817 RepID=UPI001E38F524|nr:MULTISPECIES: phosphatase [Nocardia]